MLFNFDVFPSLKFESGGGTTYCSRQPLMLMREGVGLSFEGGPVIADSYDGSAQSLAQIRENIERSDILGELVAADYRSSLLYVPLLEHDAQTAQALDYGRFNRAIEQLRVKYEGQGVHIHITGFAKIVGDLIDGLRLFSLFFAVAAAVSCAVLWIYTRCLRSTAVVLLCSSLAVLWLLGCCPSNRSSIMSWLAAIWPNHGRPRPWGQRVRIAARDIRLGRFSQTHRRFVSSVGGTAGQETM